MKKLLSLGIIGVLLLGIAAAMQIKFFYSPTCPHCQNVMPNIEKLAQEYSNYEWGFYDINERDNSALLGKYSSGVPAIVIDDSLVITGDVPINKKLNCELQQMTTRECPTYSADTSIGKGYSWFIG